MTGFLNDLGLREASTDPNKVTIEGKFPVFISDLQTKTLKKGPTLIITYKVSPQDEEWAGKTKTEFKTLPNIDPETGRYLTADDEQNAAYLKQRLLSFGVPEDELDTMTRDDLLGTPLWITLTKSQNSDFINVKEVELRAEETGVNSL